MTTEVNHHIGLEGIFNFKLTNSKTGETRQFEFKNLILNSGLERFAVDSDLLVGCILGSSGSTPVESNTAISNILGSSTTLQSYGAGSSNTTVLPYYTSRYWTYRFIEGVATGNISQVAMAYGTVNTTTNAYSGLFSLALVKDSNGTPITITKLADEVLDVTYTLRIYVPELDVTGVMYISGVAYNYTVRAAQAAAWNAGYPFNNVYYASAYTGAIGSLTSSPSGSSSGNSSSTMSSYVAGSFTRDITLFWDLNAGNIGGIRSVYLSLAMGGTNAVLFQVEYSNATDGTAIPKDATKRLTLKYRFTWGRV